MPELTDQDLDMLAVDIADAIDRYGYPIGCDQDDIRPALPAFIAAVASNAARNHPEPEDG